MTQDHTVRLRAIVGEAALKHTPREGVIGVGTGRTVQAWLDAVVAAGWLTTGCPWEAAVASSLATAERLKTLGIPVWSLNAVDHLPWYIDGTDELDGFGYCLKGGGGASTQEKILATAADHFLCLADETKAVRALGRKAPLVVEVLPMARSAVARTLARQGMQPVYREGVVTDNGGHVLDVTNAPLHEPLALDDRLNQVPGVIGHGLFARQPANTALISHRDGSVTFSAFEPKVSSSR